MMAKIQETGKPMARDRAVTRADTMKVLKKTLA
jgi:hypothetical protein